jgi:DNA-binding NtrC family response regulator
MYDTRAGTPASSFLIISADVDMRRRLTGIIPDIGCSIFEADGIEMVDEDEGEAGFRLILADIKSLGGSFQEFMVDCRRRNPGSEIILFADRAEASMACEAMRMGALDFVIMPFVSEEVEVRIRKALAWIAMRDEAACLRRRIALDFGFDNFVGISAAAEGIRHRAIRAAEVETPLLITGEPGSGREHLAKIIHHHSRRRNQPIRVCGGDADDLSFGADEAGTVIIRNVESLPERGRARLLDLFNRPYTFRLITLGAPGAAPVVGNERHGGESAAEPATAIIEIPPLRSRPEDIPALIEYFLRQISDDSGRSGLSITPEAVRRLARRTWPGNVGELENVLKTAAALAAGSVIEPDHFIFISTDDDAAAPTSESASPRSLEELERMQIVRSLEGNGWNFSQTAVELGIGRTTLWRKIKKYDLKQAATA